MGASRPSDRVGASESCRYRTGYACTPKERGMSEITLKRSPLYASLPMIYDHHDQLWPGTPSHFLDHLYNDFDYRGDDVWLSSYPRSGTAWTYEVLYAVLYEGNIAALQQAQSEGKILKFLPIEIGSAAGVSERITTWNALPSPRVIPTHVPFRLYPQMVIERHCKRVYVIRNPKDVAVSFYHHHRASIMASATPFCFCTTQKHLMVKRSRSSMV